MARGDKSAYTSKQKRQAEHIEEGYERRGMPDERAEQIAWATVNKESGGGAKSGHGRQPSSRASTTASGSRSGGEKSEPSSQKRSAAAKKGWETRRRHAEAGGR